MVELFERLKEMIYYSKRTIYFFQQQNFIKAYSYSQLALDTLQKCLVIVSKENFHEIYQSLLLAMHMLLKVMEERDELKLADIYQLEILPLLYQVLEFLSGESENLLEDYWKWMQRESWGKNQKILEKRFPDM